VILSPGACAPRRYDRAESLVAVIPACRPDRGAPLPVCTIIRHLLRASLGIFKSASGAGLRTVQGTARLASIRRYPPGCPAAIEPARLMSMKGRMGCFPAGPHGGHPTGGGRAVKAQAEACFHTTPGPIGL